MTVANPAKLRRDSNQQDPSCFAQRQGTARERMAGLASWHGLGLALVLTAGCEDASQTSTDAGPTGDDDADFDATSKPDHERDCEWQWGWVTEPSPYGTYVGDDGPALLLFPDRVEGTSFTGEEVTCDVPASRVGKYVSYASYSCEHPDGIQFITVTIGSQSWKREVGRSPHHCVGSQIDSQDFLLDDVAPCVAPNAVVLEGELLDYDPSQDAAPNVALEGPIQNFCWWDWMPPRGKPCAGRPKVVCSVEGTHYTCPSLGYRQIQMHQVTYNGHATSIMLDVEDCKVEPVTLNLGAEGDP